MRVRLLPTLGDPGGVNMAISAYCAVSTNVILKATFWLPGQMFTTILELNRTKYRPVLQFFL